ncbi:MAG: hypothetical protein Kow006_15130 [Gammaproteobacteria bacterium]
MGLAPEPVEPPLGLLRFITLAPCDDVRDRVVPRAVALRRPWLDPWRELPPERVDWFVSVELGAEPFVVDCCAPELPAEAADSVAGFTRGSSFPTPGSAEA